MSTGTAARIERLRAAGQQYAVAGDFDRAAGCYLEALEASPADADLLLQVSYMRSLAGRYREARDYTLRADAAGTTRPEVMKQLLARLRTFNEIPALLACIERMLPMSRITIPMLVAIAAQLTYVGLPERAMGFLDEARRADPDYPATLLARAHVLLYLGRFDEAGVDLARVQARAPQLAQTYWLQSQVRKQTAERNQASAIEAQLAQPRAPQDQALLAFALHKVLDDLGRHDDAWRALQRGCAVKRSQLAYDPGQTARLFAALQAFAPRDAESAASQAAAPATRERTPIFVIGMHRSGTTLLEQLLDGHSQVAGLGELYDFTSAMRHATDHHCAGVIDARLAELAPGADFHAAGRRYLEGVEWRLGDERAFVDKLPSNFLNAGFICEALPQARLLHMVRDPMETCFSNLRELFSEANAYSYDPLELGDYHAHYRALMAHWHARYPGRILDVDYARLVREPRRVLEEVCEFLGLAFEPAMLELQARTRGVVTASAVQVRGGIRAQETPKWRAYERHLQPLRDALGA